MSYNIQKLSPYLQKYNTVSSTNNLEVCVRSMLSGVSANTRIALDGQIKSLLFVGGKTKQRSPLRDKSVTEVLTPQSNNDEEIYIESIIAVVNRYFSNIKSNSDNKVKAILIKLLANNVTGFYNRFNLPKSYLDQLDCIFSDLIKASSNCVLRFKEAIESEEYLLKKLPARFEYKPLTASGIYKEYLANFDCETEGTDKQSIDNFMANISNVEDDESDSNIDVDQDDSTFEGELEMSQEEIIENIPKIIEDFGYVKVLSVRPDKFVYSRFRRLKDDKIKGNLIKIIGAFHAVYLRLTIKVYADSYKQMFKMSPSTYKENKSKVIREICDISNSEEFAQFKRLLLE